MKTLAIIPAYNEEESIVATVEELISIAPEIDFVIINDGSTDNTRDICLEKFYPLIDLPVNLGLAGGFQTGMKYALRNGYDCAVQFDADGQHDPSFIRSMVEQMEKTEANIVIASRFLEKKKHFSSRMIGSTLISIMIKLTTGKTIFDPTSGMRLFDRDVIERLAKGHDFPPEPDTVAYLLRQGLKVSEIQVSMRERTAGESYLSFTRSASYMLRTCISILLVQWFR